MDQIRVTIYIKLFVNVESRVGLIGGIIKNFRAIMTMDFAGRCRTINF